MTHTHPVRAYPAGSTSFAAGDHVLATTSAPADTNFFRDGTSAVPTRSNRGPCALVPAMRAQESTARLRTTGKGETSKGGV